MECVEAGSSPTGMRADPRMLCTRVAAILRAGGWFRLSDAVYSFDPADTATTLERWFSVSSGESIAEEWLRLLVEL